MRRFFPILLLAACAERPLDFDVQEDDAGIEDRTGTWGQYLISRRSRSGWEILDRARSIAIVVTGDDSLPSASMADPAAVAVLEERLAAFPDREIAHNFKMNGHNLSVIYYPDEDVLAVYRNDKPVRPDPTTLSEPLDPGIGERAAQANAQRCLRGLQTQGVIPTGMYAASPSRSSGRANYTQGIGKWMTAYDFDFYPSLDGLPLISAEVVITVDARSGVCKIIRVGANDYMRISDARPLITDENEARREFESRATDESAATDVKVHGRLGYYLPVGQSRVVQGPGFVGAYIRIWDAGADRSPAIGPKLGRYMDLSSESSAGLVPTFPDVIE